MAASEAFAAYTQQQESDLLELQTLKPAKRKEAIQQYSTDWGRTVGSLNVKYFALKRALKKVRKKREVKTHVERLIALKPEFFFPHAHYDFIINEKGITAKLK